MGRAGFAGGAARTGLALSVRPDQAYRSLAPVRTGGARRRRPGGGRLAGLGPRGQRPQRTADDVRIERKPHGKKHRQRTQRGLYAALKDPWIKKRWPPLLQGEATGFFGGGQQLSGYTKLDVSMTASSEALFERAKSIRDDVAEAIVCLATM